MNNRIYRCLFPVFLAMLTRAGVPPLEREISFSCKNEEVSAVLSRIEKQAEVVFSYKTSVIGGFAPVTLSVQKKTVREALSVLFKDKVSFQSRNNYIILKEKPPAKPEKKSKVSGYIYEESTGNKLANVTIYDPNTLRSATSDEYGYYEISVPSTAATLAVNKAEYRDTTVVIDTPQGAPLTNIAISTVSPGPDTTEWNRKIREFSTATGAFFKNLNGYIHTLNVRDSITRDWQVSFVPFVGTNHKMSANVYNRVSFNILGGYSRGNTGFEAGGLFNVNRENVKGVQLAGLFNIVGDSVNGFQAAGLMNVNGHATNGTHLAGLMNITPVLNGVAGAGLMNIAEQTKGAMFAGLLNVSEHADGFMGAGLFNAKGMGRGAQVAGLFNAAKEADLQVAGLFNAAGHVRGAQIGVFNFADSASGTPIGLLSFVRTGVHQLELSADEWFYMNASFRTGVPQFYNIITVGMAPGNSPTLWQCGYGLGTSFRITKWMRGELNLSAHHISQGGFLLEPSELLRFYPAFEFRFAKGVKLAAGPTLNLYLTDDLSNEFGPTYVNKMPFNTTINGENNIYTKAWFGAKIALRFF